MKKNSFHSPSLESQTIEELSKQLLEANAKLTLLQRQRQEMLSNISHDLRAPITAIRSALDLLNQNTELSPEEMRSTLGLIDRRTKTLEDLIQDMYYLFCVEDTSKALALETISAGPFLEEYFFDAIADKRYDNHDMQLDVPEDLDCQITVDVQKMIRVLDNLMTNAAKYTPAGSTITLRSYLRDADTLRIAVEDTGKGIPEDALENIFHRTYTVSNARTPGSATGSGLGLSIVKVIVERLDGRVWCESKVSEGSNFILELPVR